MEEREFREIYGRYRKKLLAFVRGKVGSLETAEDIVQELFLRIHASICCAEAWSNPDGWIYRTARNLIIDHYRSSKPEVSLDLAPEPEYPESASGSPEEGNPPPSLMEMLGSLGGPLREALEKTDMEGLTVQAYAREAGITLSAAKARVRRARAAFKSILLSCCHLELDRYGTVVDYSPRCALCDLERRTSSENR